MSAWAEGRADRVEGRALSPRSFRHFGIEAVVLGPGVEQDGLVRRDGVAIWRRLAQHAPVFDRLARGAAGISAAQGAAQGAQGVQGAEAPELLAVRVVVATTPSRDRAMRVPAVGERASRVTEAAEGPPPATGWLLLVDEGPGDTWLYLAEESTPTEVLAGFIGRRGRTDFARARRRSRLGGWGSAGIFAGLVLVFYGPSVGMGGFGELLGGALLVVSLGTLVRGRPGK